MTLRVVMCVCAPKNPCGTWVDTVRCCLMPVFWLLAATVPACLGQTSSPATAQMASQDSTVTRMSMNARATPAMVLGPSVPMLSMGTHATVPLDWEGRTAKIM